MEEKFIRQMKKGVLDMVVLKLVEEKETYGYEIIQELEGRGNGYFNLKEGTLYPVLYRLEDDGLITSSWKTLPQRTTPKKYYAITQEGRQTLKKYWQTWKGFSESVEQIWKEAQL